MSKEKKYISIKVVTYAIRDFLYALLDNGVSEYDIFITKEDDYLVVRIPMESLSSVKYKVSGDINCYEVKEDEQ